MQGVTAVNVSANHGYEWRYFASSEGSYIEQELYTTTPNMSVTAKVGDVTRTRKYPGVAGDGRLGDRRTAPTSSTQAEQVATDAVEMCTAKPLGVERPARSDPLAVARDAHDPRDRRARHGVDRIVGYEANYAGTSFVKISDIGKLKYGSKHMNITADKTDNGLGSVGYDDDGVKAQKFPIIRDGILVGLQTNRETAHLIGEKSSRGCTFAQLVARLSVPSHAQRAPRARTGQLADARTSSSPT